MKNRYIRQVVAACLLGKPWQTSLLYIIHTLKTRFCLAPFMTIHILYLFPYWRVGPIQSDTQLEGFRQMLQVHVYIFDMQHLSNWSTLKCTPKGKLQERFVWISVLKFLTRVYLFPLRYRISCYPLFHQH